MSTLKVTNVKHENSSSNNITVNADGTTNIGNLNELTVAGSQVYNTDGRIVDNEDLPTVRPSLNLDFANSKTLDPRIDFTRSSTATYYDGKTSAKAEENLYKYSQEFTSGDWSDARVDITSGILAPDGSLTASSIEQNATQTVSGNVRVLNQTLKVGSIYTASIYAKANTKTYLNPYSGYTSNGGSWFNLSTGTLGTVENDIAANIQSVGNGWYRCSVTFTVSNATNSVFWNLADTDNSTTVTDSGGIYLWGAQLEERSSVTSYTATTSTPITRYQPVLQTASANQPRFDHDPVTGEAKGLLIEEARTNLLPNSNNAASWLLTGTPIKIADAAIAPDGTKTAIEVIDDDTVSVSLIYMFEVSTITTYTASLYVKQLSSPECTFNVYTAGESENNVIFNFETETISASGDNLITSYATHEGNGWYRLVITYNSLSAGNGLPFRFWPINRSTPSLTGNVLVWGAQLEEGSFPTSYIPTSGSQVTRAKDSVLFNDIDSIVNYNDFSVYFEGNFLGRNTFQYYPRPVAFHKPSDTGAYTIGIGTTMTTSGITTCGFTKTIAGIDYQKTSTTVDLLSTFKAAGSATSTASNFSANGVASSESTQTVYIPESYTQMTIGGTTRHQVNQGMYVKKVAVYPKALTSTELTALTED